jgi:hypothetical protein
MKKDLLPTAGTQQKSGASVERNLLCVLQRRKHPVHFSEYLDLNNVPNYTLSVTSD